MPAKDQLKAPPEEIELKETDDEEEEIEEAADPEVISWMKRFARLGRMS